nr:MAG TPA: Neck appendage protein [Caudoviricetes sp.]
MIYLKEGFAPLNFAYNDEIVQEGNSKYQLSFKFPTNNPLWEELVEETLLLADDLHGEQEFIIFEVEKHHSYITVYANQVATLLNNYSITELSVNNASGDRVMRSLVSSIIREHQFTFSSDIANTHNLNLKNVTVANALFKDKHSIIGQWGGDLIRYKYDIRLLSNGGNNKEALFMYKKNLKSYQQKKSIKDLRTRIHFTKTINSQKEGEKDKVIAVTVDSPLIGKYKNIYEGNLDVSDQDVTDEATLRKYGENYFKTTLCDVIEESIEIDVVGTPDEPVGIFDTVTIFHEKFNLDVKKKITKYTYSPMGRKLKTIGFGKIQSNLGTTLASMVDNAVSEQVESRLDAFKIQKNLAQLLKLDRKGIEDKLVELEEKSKGALEVKKALFDADGTIPDIVKAKILDAVEGDIGRLKTIITEAELIKAIQAKLNYAEIKNALIDKAFINQIISDEKFTQQFEDGEVTTQNIFTKLKDSIKSNISKEFVTKDGVKKLVNDLTIDADGIRQITQQESSKVFEKKKAELKGVDSYIHKKYSDYPDGREMSDNSTLKYIGIYTGDKQQAPTNASEYSWTKIKSDGKLYKAYSNSLNGTDFTLVEPDENAKLLAKNRPRVNIVNDNDISDIWQANMFLSLQPNTKYTLTARAKGNSNKLWAYFRNNKTGEEYSWGQLEFRELETKSITFTTTEDVDDVLFKFVLVPEDEDWTGVQIDWFTIHERFKRYHDFPTDEPAQYHKYRYFGYVFKESTPVASDFEWFDLQQTSITNDKYTHIVYSDNADGSNFGREPKKYMGVARTTSPTQPTDKAAYKWFKVKGEDGERGRDGTNGHSLTATLWFTGGYVNNVTNNVKLNLKVFYDGREIQNFKNNITYKGGNFSSWQTKENPTVTSYNMIDYTFWSNGEKDGSTLFALATVTYNGLQAVADARLDNVPDVRLINETVKKYKTFESTLEGFTSVVGEIDTKVFSKSYFKNNLNSEDVEKTGNDLYFNAKENLVANEYYTILADLESVPANQKAKIYSASDGGDEKLIQNGLNYWVVKYPSNQTKINLYPLGTSTKVKNVRIYKGDFRVKKDAERENLYSSSATDDTYKFIHLNLNKNKINGNVYTVKFDASGYSNGDRWDIYNRIGYNQENLTQILKSKNNELTFTINDNTNSNRMYIRMKSVGNTTISNVEIYDVSLGYAKNKEVSRLESSIVQTKEQIDLKVSKDNIISAINLSVEKDGNGQDAGLVKIDADKVDIRGVLRAYTGEIGGFRIGANPNDNRGFWLTGKDNFNCGINPGHNAGTRGAQIWAAWGNNWQKAGSNAWWVNGNGTMVCNNRAVFNRGFDVHGAGIYTHDQDITSQGAGNSTTNVMWWSQINRVKSAISDRRLKTNIKPTKVKAVDMLNNIEMVEFNWKKDNKFEKIGAIAQQVQSVDKDLVVHDMDDKQTYNDYLRINYYDTIPYLIKAVQELSEENDNLKLRLTKLEDKINGNL